MKALLFLGLIGGGFLLGPQLLTGTSNSCHAYEQARLATNGHELNGFTRGLAHMASAYGQGAMARQGMLEQNPDIPPAVSCAIAYWGN